MRWTSTPGLRTGRLNTVNPRCFSTSQLVRARHIAQSLYQAPVVQIFDPFSTHCSPSRVAVVTAPAASEPPPGSERNWAQTSSPRSIGGMWRRFCSSVPNSSRMAMHGMNVEAWISSG